MSGNLAGEGGGLPQPNLRGLQFSSTNLGGRDFLLQFKVTEWAQGDFHGPK